MDHVLIVDDDAQIRHLLRDYLGEMGYQASEAENSRQMRQVIQTTKVDLLILDLMLGAEDGFDIARALRRDSALPIIILSARGGVLDRIMGLEMGADDFLPKPFDPRELVAKMKVILRRTRAMPPSLGEEQAEIVCFGGWRLDTRMKQMYSPEDVVVSLGGSDYRMLRTLLSHPNRPVSRDFLLDHVFGKERTPLDRSIDVCVSRLRRYLDDAGRNTGLIRTVRNEGYMLVADVHYER